MDRDFLFGVIAVQLGQATPQQVMAAASAYVADRSRSIPQRLRADGVFTDERFAMLSAMVDEALKVHGGDARRAVATLGGERAVYASFGGSIAVDAEGGVSLAPRTASESGEDATAVTPEAAGRYRHGPDAELGRGGIGRVLVAFDEHLGREVAVKELLATAEAGSGKTPGSGAVSRTAALAARFLREARVTGQLEHPNIVPVYEVGRRADGTYYYTMKVVRGRTMAAALQASKTLGDRLKLLHHYVDLCNAVAYAHSRGVIHRDIKTENVMLGEFGETVVLDWGLAKVRGKKDIRGGEIARELAVLQDAKSGHTVDGSAIGTPAYMSPEQADGKVEEIDERSDVWSLGAVLYEVLTGRPPFEGFTPFEIIGKALTEEVVAPRVVDPAIPAELSAVAMKALVRAKEGRYQKAGEIAAEIEAYTTGGRVRAYEYSAWELLRGFVARHRAVTALVGLILALVIGSSLVLLRAYRRADAEKVRAEAARRTAEQQRARAQESEAVAQLNLAVALRDNAERLLRNNDFLAARVYAAGSLLHNPYRPDAPGPARAAATAGETGEEVFVDAYSIYSQAAHDTTVRLAAVLRLDAPAVTIAFSPDGERVATAGNGSKITIWDARGFRAAGSVDTGMPSLAALAFSPDGTLLAAGGDQGTVLLYDARTLAPVERFTWHQGRVSWLAFDPGGHLVASATRAGEIAVWDLAARRLVRVAGAAPVDFVPTGAFSPDGRTLAVLTATRGTVLLWDGNKQAQAALLPVSGSALVGLAFSPDGRYLATAAKPPPKILVWDIAAGRLAGTLLGHTEEVSAVQFLPGSALLASSASDRTLRLWSTDSLAGTEVVETNQAQVRGLAVTGVGGLLGTDGFDRTVHLWRWTPAPRPLPADSPYYLAFSPDGARLAVTGHDPAIWDLASRTRRPGFAIGVAVAAAFSPDGTVIATSGHGPVQIWDAATGALRAELRSPDGRSDWYVRHIAFSPDGKTLASGDRRDGLILWDVATGAPRRRLEGRMGVAFSPDGTLLAAGLGMEGAIRLYDPRSGAEVRTLAGHLAEVDDLTFSHDGRWLASTDVHGVIRLWDRDHDWAPRVLRGHTSWVDSVAFSPDDSLLLSGADDWTARVWSVATAKTILILRTPGECVGVAFAPDGRSLALDWGDGVKLLPLDLAARDADPARLLEAAEQEAGVRLDGFSISPLAAS